MGKISTAEVLRLRATSAVSGSQSVRRSAQDDDSVGEPEEKQRERGGFARKPGYARPKVSIYCRDAPVTLYLRSTSCLAAAL